MAILPIRVYPDPVLRVQCSKVLSFDRELRHLVSDMVETMYAAPGVGLAAPQVGIELRLAVVDVSVGKDRDALKVLVNPELVDKQGREVDTEGCLSIPGINEKVARDRPRFSIVAQEPRGRPVRVRIRRLRGPCYLSRDRSL